MRSPISAAVRFKKSLHTSSFLIASEKIRQIESANFVPAYSKRRTHPIQKKLIISVLIKD